MKKLEQPFSFGFKLKSTGKIDPSLNNNALISFKRFECTTNGHNKFYEVYLFSENRYDDSYKIVTKYGKIHNTPVSDTKLFNTINNAIKYFENKVSEKLKKNYIQIKH